jgi:enoyl-CoA hydratase
VMACTGHAIAMGSFLLCSGDHRITAPAYNIQANEVAIGMVMPYAALEVVKLRLTRSAYQQAVGLANVYFGESAKAAGWVDEVVPAEKVLERAEEAAREFANLNQSAHAASKLRARAEALQGIRTGIDSMEAEFGV